MSGTEESYFIKLEREREKRETETDRQIFKEKGERESIITHQIERKGQFLPTLLLLG